MDWLRKLRDADVGKWLGDYARGRLFRERVPEGATRHVLFMIADHWEPLGEPRLDSVADARTRDWATLYPRAASRHVDADGRHPQHTFFYPYDEYRRFDVEAIAGLAAEGFGEVEVHLHHHDDTSESLRRKLEDAVELFRSHGCLGEWPDGRAAYGFVHGDWALDNSRLEEGCNFCGVDDEIRLLGRTGCYADFTFPAFGCEAQPRWVNRILRVHDDPKRPRSHERGVQAAVGRPPHGDLVLVSGPMLFYRSAEGRLRLEDGNLTGVNVPRPDRVDAWIDANVHVLGRPEWLFVKLHCHGCNDRDRLPLLERELDAMWSDLEARYNDGERYRLHYVTAREAFNILRAAEDGHSGDPNRFRDYEIARPPCRRDRAAGHQPAETAPAREAVPAR